jgi:DNA recombination protein RmuC
MTAILVLSVFTIIVCSIGIIFFMQSKIHNLLVEKTKLEERCRALQEISEQYNLLLPKYINLEKETALLSANFEQERKNLHEKIALLENAEQKLSDTFKIISSDALYKNNSAFIELARATFEQLHEKAKNEFSVSTKSMGDLVNPIKSALENVDSKLAELEKKRICAYESLKQQVSDMMITQSALKTETQQLVSALRTPSVKGRWGEMQLHRVVELAGMLEHCDFEEQVSVNVSMDDSMDDTSTKIRPDMIVYLPNNRKIVIDAKAPLSAYMEAMNTTDEKLKKALLTEHSKQIRLHVSKLSNKKYWTQFQPGPEFVVMFLPGEIFFSAATEYDSSLIEFAMQEKVIISTPTILLALLHSIALGWKQENLTENAREIIKMGRELHKRLSDMTEHMSNLGRSINTAVQNYNSTISSMESRVLVTARKFKNLESHEKNIIDLRVIENRARSVSNDK